VIACTKAPIDGAPHEGHATDEVAEERCVQLVAAWRPEC
jgi:hypothetical protein